MPRAQIPRDSPNPALENPELGSKLIMNTPLRTAEMILDTNPELADPLLDFLLWAVQPDTNQSAEYDVVLDRICASLPEFREWRDGIIESRAA